jgi:universal stress protein E
MSKFSNILYVAGSGDSDNDVFGHAIKLAENNQSTLTVIGIVDNSGSRIARALRDALLEERREHIRNLINQASTNDLKIKSKVLIGRAFTETICEVLRSQHDLVVKSVEGSQNVAQRIFGGADNKLLRQCPCPVWLVNRTQQLGYREILVALSYEPNNPENQALNKQLLKTATSLALSEFAELHIFHAWHLPHERLYRSPRMNTSTAEIGEMVQQEESVRRVWLEKLISKYCTIKGDKAADYLEPIIHLVKGNAGHTLQGLTHKLGVELVVMGTVARTGVPGLLVGNTAEAILSQVNCSVLAIKPAGFISPVTLEE